MEKTVALIIDIENISHKHADDIMEYANSLGNLVKRSAIGDFSLDSTKSWNASLNKHNIKPEHQENYKEDKDVADIAIAISITKSLFKEKIDRYVIASSDSDFRVIAQTIREENLEAYLICESKAPARLKEAFNAYKVLHKLSEKQEEYSPTELKEYFINLYKDFQKGGWADIRVIGEHWQKYSNNTEYRNYGTTLTNILESMPTSFEIKPYKGKRCKVVGKYYRPRGVDETKSDSLAEYSAVDGTLAQDSIDTVAEDYTQEDMPEQQEDMEEQNPIDAMFVKVLEQEAAIENINWNDIVYPLPGKEDWYGVFTKEHSKDEYTELQPYSISKFALTYQLWHVVLQWAQNNGYKFANLGLESSVSKDGDGSYLRYESLGKESTEYSMHPITMINWCDAIVWCNACTELLLDSKQMVYGENNADGNFVPFKDATSEKLLRYTKLNATSLARKGFRLPTEAEWEFAARFNGVDSINKLNRLSGVVEEDYKQIGINSQYAWTSENAEEQTHEVGKKLPNELGIYDMSGNVSEWCFDVYNDDQTLRCKKGGSWLYGNKEACVGKRSASSVKSSFDSLGFRLARSL